MMTLSRQWALVAVLLVGCGGKGDDTGTDPDVYLMTDVDGDGYPKNVDCDDANVAVNPGATERCDGVDNDCNDVIDDNVPDAPFWYADHDGDGFGVTAYTTTACEVPEGYSAIDGDCDDFEAAINPDAVEICDQLDNDCDAVVDGAFADGKTDFFRDGDGDGYGDADSILAACDLPPGYVTDENDCNDDDGDDHPGADERCDDIDNDCDGRLDETCGISVADAGAMWVGEEILDYSGYALAAGGDLNGDGQDDLVVGAPQFDAADTNSGRVYVVYGPAVLGTDEDPEETAEYSFGDADAVIDGNQRSAYLGYEVHTSTDFDGDGYDDLLTSAYYADADDSPDGNEGQAYLFVGPVTGTMEPSDADLTLSGEGETDLLGQYFLSGLGDIDGSGSPDIGVGAHYFDPFHPDDSETQYQQGGALYLFFDTSSGDLTGADADVVVVGTSTAEYIGYNAVGTDLDGDGVSDLAVGASGEAEVYLFTSVLSGVMTVEDADVLLDGNSGSGVGSNITTGDFDGDGNADMIVGSKYNDAAAQDSGRVWLLSGPFTEAVIDVEQAAVFDTHETQTSKYLGTQIADMSAGDIDGDGFDDLLLGSYQNAALAYQAGAALVYFGPLSGTRSVDGADRPIQGSGSSQSVGLGSSIGDMDGDGTNDVLVGARGWSYSRGAVFMFSGETLR
jgi:hypothetical protein